MAVKNIKKRNTKNPAKNSLLPRLSDKRVRIVLFVFLFGVLGTAYLLKTNALLPDGGGGALPVSRSKIIYIANAQVGQTEFGPSVLKYTDGNKEAWCADYVSWVYKTAGYPFVSGLSGGWRWPVASGTYGYSLKNYVTYIGKYKARGTYTPISGDIIFFNTAPKSSGGYGSSHVGIVLSVTANTVYTVEGNVDNAFVTEGWVDANGRVANKSYPLTSTQILGYGDMF